jgi:hypothetical protein
VYLSYLDDAGSTGRNLADKDCPFQIMGTVLIEADQFDVTEMLLGSVIDQCVPEEMRHNFEFHASRLWAGAAPFDKLKLEDAKKAVEGCVQLVRDLELIFIYGAVDKKKLSEQIYATASPVDIAFRLCIEGVEKWFTEHAPSESCLLIADDASDKVKHEIKNAFSVYRRKVRSVGHNRGKLTHMLDDMFFGSSANSLGIQLADVCNFVLDRHLIGRQDTEPLYELLEPRIYAGRMYPE